MRRLPLLCLLGLLAAPARAWTEDPPPADAAAEAALEAARRAKIRELGRELRKWAQGPYAAQHKDDLLKLLEALHVFGGPLAAEEALEAVHAPDADVRDRAFALVEKVHDKALVAPLVLLLDHRGLRRDFDLHKRVAHALAVVADVKAIEPLTALIASEDPHVVAAAADALAVFIDAKVPEKREAVHRMIDLYESTYNLMNSVRPEDQKLAKVAAADWDLFGRSLRQTLQALTKQQISRPKDWRRWWNDHKKDPVWTPGAAPTDTGDRPR